MNNTANIRIGIAGALGRMGHAVAAQASARPDISIGARFDRNSGEGLVSRDQALDLCDVIIDFSSADASAELAELSAGRGGPALVIGSTGLTDAHRARIAGASAKVPVVLSGNYSLGVNVLLGLVERAARSLGPQDYDIEVFEAHHRRKVDAPSGTALMLGEAAARGRDIGLGDASVRVRDGITGPRPDGAIGFSVMRGGGIVGEHSVAFVAEDEILTLSHSARDRGLFARGALAAAAWAAGRSPGLYDMIDVLGYRD